MNEEMIDFIFTHAHNVPPHLYHPDYVKYTKISWVQNTLNSNILVMRNNVYKCGEYILLGDIHKMTNGAWRYSVTSPLSNRRPNGVEPSRKYAMDVVEKILYDFTIGEQ